MSEQLEPNWDDLVRHHPNKPAPMLVVDEILTTIIKVKAAADGRFETLEARIEALEQRPVPVYRGVHEQGKSYLANSLTTRSGSLWIAMQATTSVPGTDSSWKLVVKKGKA